MPLKSMYKNIIRPAFFCMDPEQAHDFVRNMLASCGGALQSARSSFEYKSGDLEIDLNRVRLSNPIGLAAGFDKNGQLVSSLGALGFGFAEVGSVTARPSPGNPKPRLFRLPQDQALINRMGLNGQGAEAVAARLSRSSFSLPVGLNIAKTNDPGITGDAAIADIVFSFSKVKDLPISFVTINASCPNTHEGSLEEKRDLGIIFQEVQKLNTNQLPVYVKLSPDSSDELISYIIEDATKFGLAGYVCGNTSTRRDGLHTDSQTIQRIGAGGLSGFPLKKMALDLCGKLYRLKSADQTIIGVGGISSATDAFEFITRGANAVELYTGYVYEGPTLIREICEGLSELLKQKGLTIQSAVGSHHIRTS